MGTITKEMFENWMRTISERLDKQEKLLHSMKTGGKEKPEIARLFDNQDLCLLLQISKRTLQRYRSEGTLPYKMLGQKVYYSEDDIMSFLSNNIKTSNRNGIEFYKARINNIINK